MYACGDVSAMRAFFWRNPLNLFVFTHHAQEGLRTSVV